MRTGGGPDLLTYPPVLHPPRNRTLSDHQYMIGHDVLALFEWQCWVKVSTSLKRDPGADWEEADQLPVDP